MRRLAGALLAATLLVGCATTSRPPGVPRRRGLIGAPALLPRRSRSLGLVLRGGPDPLRRRRLLPAAQRAGHAV